MTANKSLDQIIAEATASIEEIEKEVGKKTIASQSNEEIDGLEYYTKLKNEGYSAAEIENIISTLFKEQNQ